MEQTEVTQFNKSEQEPPIGNGLFASGLEWKRLFSAGDPYNDIVWERRTAKITKGDNTVVFEQKNVEVPNFWSQSATDIVASKYFRGRMDDPAREYSAKQMVDRVAKAIGYWGLKDGYFASAEDGNNFTQDLTFLLINQYAAFNSPVWFNVGVQERPQCSACQPHRSLVSTPRGFIKIGDIVENNLIGLPVYDSMGTTRIVAVKSNGIKKVYRVCLRNGAFIEATGDHLVRAVYERRTEPFWIRLDQLKRGMRLHLYPHRSVEKRAIEKNEIRRESFFYKFESVGLGGQSFQQTVPILSVGGAESQFLNLSSFGRSSAGKDVSEAALAGWLQSDGFVGQYFHGTNNSLTIEFIVMNNEEKKWVENHLDNVFPDVHRKIRITKTKLGTSITRIRLYGRRLSSFVAKYELLKRRTEIRIPDIIWASNSEVMVAYLKSIFQAEGFVTLMDQSVHVACDTISEKWMQDLQILLFGLGIYSRLRSKKEKRENRENLTELDIAVGSERKKFAELIGFIGIKKQNKLLDSISMSGLKNIPDIREEEIMSIDDLGEEPVFDIQTESGEYLTNNIVVHNCFILSVEDNMQSILDWYRDEGWIFKYGSGSGINLSKLRSSEEPLSRGGRSSGPVSFMKGADGVANSIRSGGTTRRAAKMVILNVDHPDIKNFVYCKKIIEDMTKALERSGIKDSIEADIFDPYTLLPYQNANNSVRVNDEFMRAVEADGYWDLKAVTDGSTVKTLKAKEIMDWCADAAWHSADPGIQYDTTINEWNTCSNTGRINASNPCSEFMHLDNTACNLASLNLLKFLGMGGKFNTDFFRKAVDTMITAQEIIVGNSFYPTERITENAKNYRELGLGYANLGASLMVLGFPYDSDAGRIVAGQITSLMCGEAYRMSAVLASIKGSFAGYEFNKEPMLGVIEKHMNEAEELYADSSETLEFEDIHLRDQAKLVWQEAMELSGKYGVRNSQVTVLAPTGTIAFLMDCDTTGIEPELALVKYKKLVGGGVLKLINNQVPLALRRLGYSNEQAKDIANYILDKETIEGAPHIRQEHLPVFDCSFRPRNGNRYIHYMGHIKMMAAAQPFISGAISKTVNLPSDATVEDVKNVFMEGWRLGLKAIAVYRDGSKSIQPLNLSKNEESKDVGKDTNLIEKINGYTRYKLPDERPSMTHKFSVGGFESYLTVGFYPGTQKPGETFITTAKEGSTISGLFDTIATLISMCLQSGVPLKALVKKFKDMRFDPAGFTNNPQIPTAKSIVDYVFRYLGVKLLSKEEREEIFGVPAGHDEALSPQTADRQSSSDKILAELIQADLPRQSFSPASTRFGEAGEASAPACGQCGTLMVRAGSCYTCPNCFSTTGVCN